MPSKEIVAMHSSSKNERGIIKFSKSYLSFDVFNAELEPLFTKAVELQKKETYQAKLYFEDEIKIFTLVSPKKRERYVYCHTFNLNTKVHSKALLFEKVLEKNQRLFLGKNKRQTSFAKSPNGKFIAMSTDDSKKTTNSYTIHLYNAETLELIFQRSYHKETAKYFKANDLSLDNLGNVYVVGKLFLKGKADRKHKKANYEFVINKINEEEAITTKIQLGEYFVNTLSFAPIKEKVTLVGFYSKKRSNRTKGVCSFTLNYDDLSSIEKKSSELPQNIYSGLYENGHIPSRELSNFYVDYVLEDSNGDIFMIAEEFYITTSHIGDGQTAGMYTTTNHYDDILVIKYNKDGELEWGNSIYKRSLKPSYNAFLLNGNAHLILNSGKNLKKKNDGRTKVSKGWFESSALYDIVLSPQGEISYDKIQDNNKGNSYYLPAKGTFTSDNSFIMMNEKYFSPMRKLMLLK